MKTDGHIKSIRQIKTEASKASEANSVGQLCDEDGRWKYGALEADYQALKKTGLLI